MAYMEFNGSNYSANWSSIWMLPYTHVFGDMFLTIVLLSIAAGIYVGTDRNTFITALYCLVVAVIFGPIFNMYVSSFILLIVGLVFSMITYNAVIEKKPR